MIVTEDILISKIKLPKRKVDIDLAIRVACSMTRMGGIMTHLTGVKRKGSRMIDLKDGLHRLIAAKAIGMTHVPMIYQCDDGWYQRNLGMGCRSSIEERNETRSKIEGNV